MIIPTRNRTRFLESALASVLTQTEAPGQIVLVDDHSDAPAWKEVQRLAQLSPRIELLRLKEHRGVSAARNAGLTLAQGDFIQFLDDDDLLEPRAIETSLGIFRQQADVDAVVCGWRVLRMPDAPGTFPTRNYRIPRLARVRFSTIVRHCFAIHACLIRRTAIADLRFPEDLSYAEDQYFWLTLARQGCRFVTRPERDAVIRRHALNATNTPGPDTREALRVCYRRVISDGHGLDEDDRVLMHLKLAYWGAIEGRAGWGAHMRRACVRPGRVLGELAAHAANRMRLAAATAARASGSSLHANDV